MNLFLREPRHSGAAPGSRHPKDHVESVRVTGLSHEGRGIARVDGKTVFLDGALPGETVRFRYLQRHGSYDEGEVLEVECRASERIEPACRYFSRCGGCSLQHVDAGYQLKHKESVLLDHLKRSAGLEPRTLLPAIPGPAFGYRRKARLSVRYAGGRAVVGFRGRRSGHITQLESCEVLHPRASALLPDLSRLVGTLSVRRRVPQIEVAVDEDGCDLVFRHLRPLTPEDLDSLRSFERRLGARIFLQPGSDDTVHPLSGCAAPLRHYRLDSFDIDLEFGPVDFTQVNFEINGRMVDTVMDLLQPAGSDRVLDLFCGIGNFSLPLARRAGTVTGLEGSASLVARARANAQRNQLDNVDFHSVDLGRGGEPVEPLRRTYEKVLIDPPRAGALTAILALDLSETSRLAYVSCNPATLARDAAVLVNERGLVLSAAGVIDMFPQTAHVESVALFENPHLGEGL